MNTEPTLIGPAGKGWRTPEQELAHPGKSTVDHWWLELPRAHPLWSAHMFAIIHLRDVPDAPPAVIEVPGATHEVMLYALDPAVPLTQQFETKQCKWLTPPTFLAQIKCSSDSAARTLGLYTASEMVNGQLIPDTDYLHMWIERFGDGMLKK